MDNNLDCQINNETGDFSEQDGLSNFDIIEKLVYGQPVSRPAGFIMVYVEMLYLLMRRDPANFPLLQEKPTGGPISYGRIPDLKPSDFIVLNYVLSRMEWNNWYMAAQADMARDLESNQKASPANLNRSLKTLEAWNLLQRVFKNNRFVGVLVNPELAAKGKPEGIANIKSAYDELRTKNRFREVIIRKRKEVGQTTDPQLATSGY